jgi:hypothetical protein
MIPILFTFQMRGAIVFELQSAGRCGGRLEVKLPSEVDSGVKIQRLPQQRLLTMTIITQHARFSIPPANQDSNKNDNSKVEALTASAVIDAIPSAFRRPLEDRVIRESQRLPSVF